jgi:signal transduction histidine kinase
VPELATAALLWVRREGLPARAWLAHGDAAVERSAAPALAEIAPALAEVPAVARAVESRRPVTANGAGGCWPAALAELARAPESVTVPLVTRRRTIGTLTLFLGPQSGLRLPGDIGVAEELAHRCAIALENAALFSDAQEAIRARDEFLAIASHELKTPLTPLRITVQALKRATARDDGRLTPERRDELFRAADHQIGRLAGLVDDLLDATRIGTRQLRLQRQAMDLAEVVRGVVDRHSDELVQAGCALSLALPPGVTGVWDRTRIEQVATNLLTNTMKYAPGASVEVRVEGDEQVARLVVRDHGPGIAADDQDRIFRPFERAMSYMHVSGFGLGLYIVREIVGAHGGTVRLQSAPGSGSTFTVELPRGSPC